MQASFAFAGDAPKSGAEYMREMIATYFDTYSVPAVVAPVGLKYRSFTIDQAPGNAGRIVVIPGEFDGDTKPKTRRLGTLSRETDNTHVENPREILSWQFSYTISVWAAPGIGRPESEGPALDRAINLAEQVARALNGSVTEGALEWGDVNIVAPPVEKAFGQEILLSLTQRQPLFDRAYDVVYPIQSVSRG